jgi:predicted nucleic acid-binding protein
MRYVLDSSVAIKWVLPESDSPRALQLQLDFASGTHDLIAPDVFAVECAHSLTRAERRRLITPQEGAARLRVILSSLPALSPSLPLLYRAYDISSAHRIGVYDCLYVALAEREGSQLVTADDRLVRVLQPHFPFIVPLASLP